MMNKVFSKFKTFGSIFLLKAALFFNNPQLAAVAMSFVAWRIGNGKTRVLCLGRTIFVDDVKAMAKYSGQIQYFVVHLQYFEILLSYFVPRAERSLITEANYLTSTAGLEGRKNYHEFLMALLPKICSRLGIEAILSGHLSYVVQQEIITAATAVGIPFIVLHKEALDVYGGILETYRNYKFAGAKILFYNETVQKVLIERVAGLSFDNTAVVGIPRFDFYFQNRITPKPKHITFFCFFPLDKFLPLIKDEARLAAAKQAYKEFHKLVIDFAARHPDFHITLKTKAAPHYLEYVQEIYRSAYQKPLPNLTITNFAATPQLIQNSEAIIGFDSTVLIEAVAADRPIIRPDFRDFVSDDRWDFLAGYDSLVHYAKTREDLEKYLLDREPMKLNAEIRKNFLTHLIGKAEGGASTRAERAIIETIKNYR